MFLLPQKPVFRCLKLTLIIAALIPLAGGTSFAENTGNIHGRIIDGVTGQGVPDAHVVLTDTKISASTDLDGYFVILQIPPGEYTVALTCPNYRTLRISSMVITAGQSINLYSVQLTPSNGILQDSVLAYKDFKLLKTSAVAEEDTILESVESIADITMMRSKKAKAREYGDIGAIALTEGARAHDASAFMPPSVFLEQPPPFNTEEYDRIYENEFIEVIHRPLSTFSIDVDAASYGNVRRYINQGQFPPKDAVRIEELINYFSYDYPDPSGKHPFSITTEMSVCPWNEDNQLVHIGLQGEKIDTKDLPPGNLVFLLDVSGSMSPPNKLPLLKSAFKMLVGQLRKIDRVAIVVYAGSAGLVLPSTQGDEKETILEAIDRLQAGGTTAGGAGIRLAYKIAKENFAKKGNNRVILATDGDFNTGISSTSEMVRLIEEKREDGIFLTVLGFGMGNYKDNRMESLADKGNGNYAYIDNIMEARKVLVSELGGTLFTIAKDVKLQIEFNPAKVKAYRLVGYENRLLADKDFHDDTKDAGELGAGHTVTALYEIILPGSDVELPETDQLKYQKSDFTPEAFESNEAMTIKLRYKKPDKDTSLLLTIPVVDHDVSLRQSSENFRFSAAVAEFGMLLRDSKFKGTASFDRVASLAKDSKGKDANGYRAEFIRLVETCSLLSPPHTE